MSTFSKKVLTCQNGGLDDGLAVDEVAGWIGQRRLQQIGIRKAAIIHRLSLEMIRLLVHLLLCVEQLLVAK